MKFLHVYAQHYEHSTAFIVGNREGLKELKRLIDDALETGNAESTLFTYDGEEFNHKVILFSGEDFELAKPYIEATQNPEAIWPGDIGVKIKDK